jgi:hypothetical protein
MHSTPARGIAGRGCWRFLGTPFHNKGHPSRQTGSIGWIVEHLAVEKLVIRSPLFENADVLPVVDLANGIAYTMQTLWQVKVEPCLIRKGTAIFLAINIC